MAVQKKKKEEPGVPEWVVTFGDLMSLLLTFFILLQMFSELKKDHEYQRVITAVREAFGYNGGVGVLPVDDPPLKSMIQTLESMAVKMDQSEAHQSANVDPGVQGTDLRVTRIRDGVQFTLGGPSTFDRFSAVVKPDVRKEVERLVPMLKGRRNRIRVVGHSESAFLPEGSPWRDHDELAFARARAIGEVMEEFGIDPEAFRYVSSGDREPVRSRASGSADDAQNRRVDVILTDVLIDEVDHDARHTDVSSARGG